MMEEEKLRRQEEEGGSVFEEEEEEPEKVIEAEDDVPSLKKSPSHLSALSYELFVEQYNDVVDDNGDDNVVENGEAGEDEEEETRELVTSPGDNLSHRKVSIFVFFLITKYKHLTNTCLQSPNLHHLH